MSAVRSDPLAELQKTVAAWLAVMLPKPPLGPMVSAIAPAPGNSAKLRALRRHMGLKPGMPELMLIWQGRPLFIALAPLGVEPDVQQRLRHLEITQCGGAVTVCRSLQEVVELVPVRPSAGLLGGALRLAAFLLAMPRCLLDCDGSCSAFPPIA